MPAVIVPFAGTDEHRLASLAWTTRRYRQLGWHVEVGRTDLDPWCKARAVTEALAKTRGELVIIADADVWADDIEASVIAVRDHDTAWAVPHTKVYRLSPRATQRVLAGGAPDTKHSDLARVPHVGIIGGGIVVLRRELYLECPLDSRFVGWGGEDHSLGYALETLAGPAARSAGPLWHLWHPPQPRENGIVAGTLANERLRIRYLRARKNPTATRALIDEAVTR